MGQDNADGFGGGVEGLGDAIAHWCQVKEIGEKSRKYKQPETKGKTLIG
jgi:hypothetical protein